MTVSDLDSVIALERRISDIPWSYSLFREEVSRGNDRYYTICELSSRLVGYLGSMIVDEESHITNVAVEPELWGNGIASMLLLDALDYLAGRGVKDCTLEVRAGNFRAQRLYQRFGFSPVGIRRGYYHDNGEDAIIMWLYGLDGSKEWERRDQVRKELIEAGKGLVERS
jgi:ribosomal-protein-alanine N-acetyltransferase